MIELFHLILTEFDFIIGGAYVHFHIILAESRKYFRNAISMSEVVDNYVAMSKNNDHLEFAYKMSNDFGGPKNTFEKLLEFLKSTPADKLSQYNNI